MTRRGERLIRLIDGAERDEIGRKLYEARASGMVWADAARIHFDNGLGLGREDTARAAYLARLYAGRAGLVWPPLAPNFRKMPGYGERRAAISAKRAERNRIRGMRWAADIRDLRQSLGIDDDTFRRAFHLSTMQAASLERRGPVNMIDYDTVIYGLKDLGRRRLVCRDWLILTNRAA